MGATENKPSKGALMRSLKEWIGPAIGGAIVLGVAVVVLAESDALGDEFKTIALRVVAAVMLAGLLSIVAWGITHGASETGGNWSVPKRVAVFALSFVLLVGLAYGCGKACEPGSGGIHRDEIDPDREWRPR